MIMLKLIEAKRFGDRNTSNGRRVQRVVLRKEKAKNWTTARFNSQQVLNVALKEIESNTANH